MSTRCFYVDSSGKINNNNTINARATHIFCPMNYLWRRLHITVYYRVPTRTTSYYYYYVLQLKTSTRIWFYSFLSLDTTDKTLVRKFVSTTYCVHQRNANNVEYNMYVFTKTILYAVVVKNLFLRQNLCRLKHKKLHYSLRYHKNYRYVRGRETFLYNLGTNCIYFVSCLFFRYGIKLVDTRQNYVFRFLYRFNRFLFTINGKKLISLYILYFLLL